MKLAELLIRKGIVKKHLKELESTLENNVRVPEDSVADCEEVEPILEGIAVKYEELYHIGATIGKYNRVFEIAPGQTIDDALVRRDLLIKRLTNLREVYRTAKSDRTGYHRDNDVKYIVLLSPLRLRALIDGFQTELNELETKIQIANWKHDIPECVENEKNKTLS
jgi:hypothetical protein